MADTRFAGSALTIRPQYHFRQVEGQIHIWFVPNLVGLVAQQTPIELPLSAIAEIDEPYWYAATGGTPTVRSVAEHGRQIAEADLAYPILLCPDLRVIDGMHRVAKAMMSGAATISAVVLPSLPAPEYINKHPDDLPYDRG